MILIILPLYVSTVLRHLQGTRNQYPAKLHKYVNAVLVIQSKISHMFSAVNI